MSHTPKCNPWGQHSPRGGCSPEGPALGDHPQAGLPGPFRAWEGPTSNVSESSATGAQLRFLSAEGPGQEGKAGCQAATGALRPEPGSLTPRALCITKLSSWSSRKRTQGDDPGKSISKRSRPRGSRRLPSAPTAAPLRGRGHHSVTQSRV